jgi:hypothetical protein
MLNLKKKMNVLTLTKNSCQIVSHIKDIVNLGRPKSVFILLRVLVSTPWT